MQQYGKIILKDKEYAQFSDPLYDVIDNRCLIKSWEKIICVDFEPNPLKTSPYLLRFLQLNQLNGPTFLVEARASVQCNRTQMIRKRSSLFLYSTSTHSSSYLRVTDIKTRQHTRLAKTCAARGSISAAHFDELLQ